MNFKNYVPVTDKVIEFLNGDRSGDMFVVKYSDEDDDLHYIEFVGVEPYIWKLGQLAFDVESQREQTEWAEVGYHLLKKVRKLGQFGEGHVYASEDSIIIVDKLNHVAEYARRDAWLMAENILLEIKK